MLKRRANYMFIGVSSVHKSANTFARRNTKASNLQSKEQTYSLVASARKALMLHKSAEKIPTCKGESCNVDLPGNLLHSVYIPSNGHHGGLKHKPFPAIRLSLVAEDAR